VRKWSRHYPNEDAQELLCQRLSVFFGEFFPLAENLPIESKDEEGK
jgi:hypothetical protein